MENIMLDEKQKQVKLVDFGLSITFTKDELMKTHCGSPEYAAPELFAAKDRYGPEIDVWSLGIVMYAMMLGRLPFTTPYTDHYRRQKLVQQMEKGLTEIHNQEMNFLSQDCQDMLRKVIEPSPEQRLPLLDMEVHPWVTNNAKLPFFPFQAFPRDKTMRHQGSPSLRQQNLQDSMCSTDEDETMAELSVKLELKKEQVEQKVGESKSDEMSAMYNMLLDAKRREQGLYDFDHTSKPMDRRDGKTKRRAKSADDKKSRTKGGECTVPPALVIPAPQVSVEAAPATAGEANPEPETRMTSFDFLALCSTPSWLGPEKRRSRRRNRSPNPTPQHNRSRDGDYLERQSMEASHAREDHQQFSPNTPHSRHNSSQHGNSSHSSLATNPAGTHSAHLLSPDQTLTLAVPDTASAHSNLRRGSSLKLSRRRSRSFGPRHKRGSSFQRSGSVDTPPAENDMGGRLKGAKSDTLATTSASTLSVAAASLAVAFGGRTSNVLQVPGIRRPDLAPQQGSVSADNLLTNHVSMKPQESAAVHTLPPVGEGPVKDEGKPLANVEVHMLESAKPSHSLGQDRTGAKPSEVVRDTVVPRDSDRLMLPALSALASDPSNTWSTESLLGDSEVNLLPSPDLPDEAAVGRTPVQPLDLLDCSQRPVFHQQVPPHSLSLQKNRPVTQMDDEHTAMQDGQTMATVSSATPQHNVPDSLTERGHNAGVRDELCCKPDPSLKTLTLDGLVGATGISGNLKDDEQELVLVNEVDVTTEDDDDSVFVAHSDSAAQFVSAVPRNRAIGNDGVQPLPSNPYELADNLALVRTDSKPTSAQESMDTPPVEMVRKNKRGSAGSTSQASSSGSRSQKRGSVTLQGSKLKTPTTPLSWMVIHSPLARIDSFHSDDFELFNSSEQTESTDQGSAASNSPMSASTPTLPIPCFAYKLSMARKKLPKLLKGTSDHDSDSKGCKSAPNGGEFGKCNTDSPLLEPAATDPLLSSGSETEQIEDTGERSGASKAKVHPEGKDSEKRLLRAEGKGPICNNVITQQPCRQAQQNVIKKKPPNVPCLVLEPKKKAARKNSPWTCSLAEMFKHKKQNPRCNNNNNDCASSPMLPANHNGCSPRSPGAKLVSNNMQVSHAGRMMVNSAADSGLDITGSLGNCKPRGYVPASEKSTTEGPEFQSPFPNPPASPDMALGARVFDFTLLNDSPKGRPCLLSWRPCGDCATTDLSSEDESECNPDPVVMLDLKPLGKNNVSDHSHNCPTSHDCTGT